MSDDRPNRDKPFLPRTDISVLVRKIEGKPVKDPLTLPKTTNIMEFQRAMKQRRKAQRVPVRIPAIKAAK